MDEPAGARRSAIERSEAAALARVHPRARKAMSPWRRNLGGSLFLALVAGGSLASCQPCNPGPLIFDFHIDDRSVAGKGRHSASGQRLLVADVDQTVGVAIQIGQCSSGGVPSPGVSVTSPNGSSVSARVEQVAPWDPAYDIVYSRIGFKEAGNYQVNLTFPGRTVSFLALASRDRSEAPYQVFDGACDDLFATGPGTMSCLEVSRRLNAVDGGLDGPLEYGAAIIRDGGVAFRFGVGTRVFPAAGEYWVTTPDAGLARYAETSGTPAQSPANGLALAEEVIDVAPVDSGAWVLTASKLLWAEKESGALVAKSSLSTPTPVGSTSLILTGGSIAFVLNRLPSGDTESCGYSIDPVRTVTAISGSCATNVGELVGGDHAQGWLLDRSLRTVVADSSSRAIVTTATLLFPPVSSGTTRSVQVLRRRPVFFDAGSWLVARLVGGAIVTEVYFQAGTQPFGIAGGDDTSVWARNPFAEDSPTGRVSTQLFSRD